MRYRLSRFHPYDYILEYFLFYQFSRCASRKQYRFRPYTSYAKQLDVSGLGAGDGHGKPYQQGRSLRRGAMLGCPSVNPLANLQLGRMLSISIEILPLFSDLLISEVISGKALTVFNHLSTQHVHRLRQATCKNPALMRYSQRSTLHSTQEKQQSSLRVIQDVSASSSSLPCFLMADFPFDEISALLFDD